MAHELKRTVYAVSQRIQKYDITAVISTCFLPVGYSLQVLRTQHESPKDPLTPAGKLVRPVSWAANQ